jgi:mRNA interferase MazF
MKRGELYLVSSPGRLNPRKQRIFAVVSRQVLLDSKFSTAICAPIYSRHDGPKTQVAIGIAEGVKHESSVHCDELFSVPKVKLTRFVGALRGGKLDELDRALVVALELSF